MGFDFATIYVPDLERSLRFYRDLLGLAVIRRHPIEDGELAFLGVAGQPSLEIIGGPAQAGHTYGGFSIGIAVASLEEATEKLAKAGHPVIRGPFSPGPGVRFSFVKDPDGIEVELIEYRN